MPWLRERIAALPGDQHWRMLAKGAMLDDLAIQARHRCGGVARWPPAAPASNPAAARQKNQPPARSTAQAKLLAELRAVPTPDSAMPSVTLREEALGMGGLNAGAVRRPAAAIVTAVEPGRRARREERVDHLFRRSHVQPGGVGAPWRTARERRPSAWSWYWSATAGGDDPMPLPSAAPVRSIQQRVGVSGRVERDLDLDAVVLLTSWTRW